MLRRVRPPDFSGGRSSCLPTLPFFERHPAPIPAPNVYGLWPDKAVQCPLLEALRRPPRYPPCREGRGEELRGQPKPVKQQRRVELDVGLQVPAGLVLSEQCERRLFDIERQLVEFFIPVGGVKALGSGGEHVCPGVAYAVDPVPETHEPLASPKLLPQVRLGPARVPDLEHHIQRGPWRAAVQRSLERPDRPDHSRDEVRACSDDYPRREGGGVHAMIGDSTEVCIEGPRELCTRHFVCEHVQIVGSMAKLRVRGHRLLAI